MPFVSCLECTRCGKQLDARKVCNLCECGGPLFVRYELDRVAARRMRERLASRPATLWRYWEVLPLYRESAVVSLGEGFTPLIHAERLGRKLGLGSLYLKDESANPTGSFKARGLSMAVSCAVELGVKKLVILSAGNAAGALAAYAAHAGIEAAAFMPEATPLANRLECALMGAEVVLVPGSIKDCGRAARERQGWFDVSTLREPYRLEGKKTLAYEVMEQLNWRVPDALVYPTGGGTGLIGMWKAFGEMQDLEWIGERRPRMFAVQAAGCAPIVRAFAEGSTSAREWENPETLASGLRVPEAIGDFLMLGAIRESHGAALAVEDSAMLEAVKELAETEGIVTSPEGGATLAALKRLLADGLLAGYETVVLFLTASGYKYMEVLETLDSNRSH